MPWHPQILADQLTLSQPGGTDYAQLITTGTPGFSDLPTALMCSYLGFENKVLIGFFLLAAMVYCCFSDLCLLTMKYFLLVLGYLIFTMHLVQ